MNDLLNINIIEYIKKKCFDLNTDPIIICNTIVTYKFVEILYTSKFEVYWYIHEWLEDKYINKISIKKQNPQSFFKIGGLMNCYYTYLMSEDSIKVYVNEFP
jgi:hypothetical protein